MIPPDNRRRSPPPAEGLYRENSEAFRAYQAEAGRWRRFAAGGEEAEPKKPKSGSGGSFFASFRRSFAGTP